MAKLRRSWKQELDDKYNQLTNLRINEVIDKANDVILEAIEKLDKIKREMK